jgi:putative membrane protein insertion efficiency factor
LSNAAKFVTLQLLRAYKWAISPLFPPACRFVPTCSEYAMEAVERYGALRGGWMAFTRILRCHPLARPGYDPVVKQAQGAEQFKRKDQAQNAERAQRVEQAFRPVSSTGI